MVGMSLNVEVSQFFWRFSESSKKGSSKALTEMDDLPLEQFAGIKMISIETLTEKKMKWELL